MQQFQKLIIAIINFFVINNQYHHTVCIQDTIDKIHSFADNNSKTITAKLGNRLNSVSLSDENVDSSKLTQDQPWHCYCTPAS